MQKIFREEQIKLNPLAQKIIFYKRMLKVPILLVIQIAVSIYFTIKLENNKILYYILLGLVLAIIYSIYVYYSSNLFYQNYSYTIGENGITIQEGYFTKSRAYIPYNIIQTVELNSGVIMRKFNFVNVDISLIQSRVSIVYLPQNKAKELREEITNNKNRYKLKF